MKKATRMYGYTLKLSSGIVMCLVILALSILVYNYDMSEEAIKNNIEGVNSNLLTSIINRIDAKLNTGQQIPQDISNILESCVLTPDEIMVLLKNAVKNCPEIYGSTVAFEPYILEKDKHFFGPHFYKTDGKIAYLDLGTDSHNYLNSEWYTIPKQLNKSIWSEPYFDKNNVTTLLVTYSDPFFRFIDSKRKFCGVTTCDIDLSFLKDIIEDAPIPDISYLFILSSKGIFIECPDNEYVVSKKSIFSIADDKKDPDLRNLGEKMVSGQTGFEECYLSTFGQNCIVAYAPIKEIGWSVCIITPKDKASAELYTIIWNLFAVGAIGYTLILILVVTTLFGFLWIRFYVRGKKTSRK